MNKGWLSFLTQFFSDKEVYIAEASGLKDPYQDQEGTVVEEIALGRRGRIYCSGSFWPARCIQPMHLMPNTLVQVKGRDNITLLVEPLHEV